ncbi:helix-turn-helix domain-containing protein [Mycobacterium sp.]|jgi:AcrR family transcriptional regulator|uniref:TetR/AcrR family transcriptional regulator n=1 Tax=Mycobacterium sp. TaxID=1785 RepID=UPI002D3D2F13|nr:helix-turn-helix domain-containing protein [Mycobacterium sp.]HZA12585.1 helix-turn-helix domain-containing protein [Mycobacterium sp.]
MRARLIDATIDCLVKYGYAGTTTPRVAETAGVTRGAQVHHFGSKNDLVTAALKHLAAKRTAAAVAEVVDLATAQDPLGTTLDLLWDLHQGPMFIATVELWVAGRTDVSLGREVAKFESIVQDSLLAAVAQFVPEEINKPMLDFLYTAMDALRGILIASYVDNDQTRARRRWDRAAANLRRIADPLIAEWVARRG